MLAPPLQPESLFGKYRIVRRLDRGLGWESYEAARGGDFAIHRGASEGREQGEMRVLLKVARNVIDGGGAKP